jgi:hypothetical protein
MDRTTRRGARRSMPQRIALQFGVLLVMFGFQINVLAIGVPVVYTAFYAALLGCFLVALGGRIQRPALVLLIGAMFVTTLLGNPLKGLGLGVGAYIGHLAATKYEADYRRVMVWLLAVNAVIVVIQILGVWPAVYQFANYSSEGRQINLLVEPFAFGTFLPQLRPAGMFPAMTYVSAWSVLLYSTVVAAPGHEGRVTPLLAGVFMASLGSSVGLMLALGSVLLMFSRPGLRFFVCGYLIAAVLYATYLPEQFAYNFNAEDLRISFQSRLDPSSDSVESILRNDVAGAVVLCVAGAGFLVFTTARVRSLAALAPPGVALALPFLVHDISLTLFYWFLIGAVTAPVLRRGRLRVFVANAKRREENRTRSSLLAWWPLRHRKTGVRSVFRRSPPQGPEHGGPASVQVSLDVDRLRQT